MLLRIDAIVSGGKSKRGQTPGGGAEQQAQPAPEQEAD